MRPDHELPPSIFERDGDRWVPTELARGPWAPDSQHGGPPAALLGRMIADHEDGGEPGAGAPWFLARITIELLRPVPLAPLEVDVRTIRPGRRVQLVEGVIRAGGQEVVRAVGLRLTAAALDLDESSLPVPEAAMPRPPADSAVAPEFGIPHLTFGDAMEIRCAAGAPMGEPGPATCWFRLRVPFVAGEATRPIERVLTAADFPNGISNVLDFQRFVYINPDLTVSLHRLPAGDWVAVDAVTWARQAGHGMADAMLLDEHGPIGRAVQSLLIGPR